MNCTLHYSRAKGVYDPPGCGCVTWPCVWLQDYGRKCWARVRRGRKAGGGEESYGVGGFLDDVLWNWQARVWDLNQAWLGLYKGKFWKDVMVIIALIVRLEGGISTKKKILIFFLFVISYFIFILWGLRLWIILY